jgi:hypothetical protein
LKTSIGIPACCFLIAFIGCGVVLARQDDGIGMEGHIRNGSLVFETAFVDGPRAEIGSLITGQPYSAVQVSEHTETLANGTHIQQKWESALLYRDSQGRTRTERFTYAGALPVHTEEPGHRLIRICDPMAGYVYVLDTKKHIAHRLKILTAAEALKRVRSEESAEAIRPPQRIAASPGSKPPSQRPEIKQEALGKEVTEGVQVAVRRITMTTPEGLDGNDQPLVRVCENQYSEELKLTILSKCSDPRAGDSVTRLENLERTDPNPALFQVPVDYAVVEETDQFRIELGTPEAPRER